MKKQRTKLSIFRFDSLYMEKRRVDKEECESRWLEQSNSMQLNPDILWQKQNTKKWRFLKKEGKIYAEEIGGNGEV